MIETTELDTAQEEAPTNGHDATFLAFDDDMAFLTHILSKKPAEELTEVPEWNVKILCKALDAEARIAIQIQAYTSETKITDYRPFFPEVVVGGCYNPTTGNKVFTEKHLAALRRKQDGMAIERLAVVILRLSHMLFNAPENAKKN
jgi:hypothetical protein